MTTAKRLQTIIPGQTAAWYTRIAAEIDAGKMPMPTLEPIKDGTYSYSKADLNPLHRTEVIKPTTQSPKPTTQSPKPKPTTAAAVKVSDRLVNLCNGNRETAMRLVGFNIQQNPTKSSQWAIDKAIWDLERDRGAR